MKTPTKHQGDIPSVTFRPNMGSFPIIAGWDETGYDRTLFINALITKYGEKCKDELLPKLQGLGLSPKSEPLTPFNHNALAQAA